VVKEVRRSEWSFTTEAHPAARLGEPVEAR